MPILRGSVTFSRYRLEHRDKPPSDVKRWLLKGLKSHLFEDIDRRSDDERAAGFVELENSDGTEFPPSALFYAERALFTWRVDQLKVPGAQVKAELEKWKAAFERENARRPSRGETAEHRNAVRQMLRSKATPVTRTHDVAWNMKTNELQLWTSSRKIAEEIQIALEEALSVKLLPLSAGAKAVSAEIPDAAVAPTAALLGVEVPVTEVMRGEA